MRQVRRADEKHGRRAARKREGVVSAVRQALVQAAHLVADALEKDTHHAGRAAKAQPVARAKRRQCRKAWAPPNDFKISDIDMERARQIAKRVGIPIK
jgi:hypothetical protein